MRGPSRLRVFVTGNGMPLPLLSSLSDVPVAFFDVETTGASPRYGDRVTEVGLARFERGQLVDRYSQLLNPQRRISPGVVALTGISNEMVANEPTFDLVATEIADRMRGAVIVGHNVRFDLAFIEHEFRRVAIDLPSLFELNKVLDTVRIARRCYGRGGNGLQKLACRLGIVVETAHRALADCLTTAGVFETMLQPTGGWAMSLADTILLQGGPCSYAVTEPTESLPIELEDALAARSPVRLVYLDARNNRTERIVVPTDLRAAGDDRALHAYCTLRHEQRVFKLSRVVELSRVEADGC